MPSSAAMLLNIAHSTGRRAAEDARNIGGGSGRRRMPLPDEGVRCAERCGGGNGDGARHRVRFDALEHSQVLLKPIVGSEKCIYFGGGNRMDGKNVSSV